ncbi:Tat (twin-arginine translocation) pathway signal sequence [Tistlia consotensis]|uniref:Tat (Twin-arginine translocation) pathway signal sequence n=1 Tax=Tistlia consotensis USBA 355 TaxID=560819 RepID=A0A1Y6CLE7_9PROT|nr:twin-arginine translocation signal domain-containing protein [Tistlia consotensis]SMF75469.1 Tat (twin-arginine translocation) pathway signal sequence [Tistlia consotensis USBA 355]SNS08021.1 Tat (twin-arginine translocation) pathway signal sequence [Tistlia consotensis]
MTRKGMNRRQFLQGSALATAAALGSGALAGAARALAAELELSTLDPKTAAGLLVMTRRIYPHDTLADQYYGGVVEALDEAAKADPAVAALLKDGVAGLDLPMEMAFLELSEGNQLKVLTGLAGTPFFQKVRGTAVVALYNNELVWRHFGYEGASFPYGGYLHRGFDDLAWLPQPPEDASPKAE